MTTNIEMERTETLSWIFNEYADSNGEIPVKRFGEIIETYRSSLSERTIQKLLRYADTNKDGFINKREIVQLESQDTSKTAAGAGVREEDVTMLKKGWKRVGRFVLPKQEDQLEYYEHYSCMPPPMFMILISVIEIAFYIYNSATYDNWFGFPYQLIDSPLIFNPRFREQVWRFFSYMFLHAGLEHCFFNVLVQLVLGIPLEMVHGGLRVGAIYVAGVVAGSLASSVFDPFTALVGASGGVYALITAQLANVILNGDVMHKMSSFIRAAFVILMVCGDFGYSIYRRLTSEVVDQVSFVAHVAGAIAGLSMGLLVLINFKKNLGDKIAFWIAVVIYVAFMLFAVSWNIFWPGYKI